MLAAVSTWDYAFVYFIFHALAFMSSDHVNMNRIDLNIEYFNERYRNFFEYNWQKKYKLLLFFSFYSLQ